MSQSKSASSEDEQALEVDIAEMNVPNLLPDLTLRYPPKAFVLLVDHLFL